MFNTSSIDRRDCVMPMKYMRIGETLIVNHVNRAYVYNKNKMER